jgi:peptidoglycan/xylan/chitin deacetylase (PgdA/CDA1 family)
VLDKDVTPVAYIEDQCQYLKDRWDPNKSIPGTVVMVVMFHSVTKDSNPLLPDGSQVHHSEAIKMLEHAHEVGFQTITADQLAGFLEKNERIPARSLLIIVDDRKRKEFYETHFIPHLKEYGWKITNAWISAKDTPEYLWKENEEVVQAGWVDVQAHGVVHNIPIGEYSTDEYIRGELYGSIEAIEKHYGKRPVAFIWPGGGFTARAAELAHEAGYQLGFTTNPRGPVMFNWIPQAEKADPNHPNWLPEIPAGDPLMTLPRYWSMDAAYRIDDVITIGDDAVAEAAKNKDVELTYYDVMCKSRTGEIPTLAP